MPLRFAMTSLLGTQERPSLDGKSEAGLAGVRIVPESKNASRNRALRQCPTLSPPVADGARNANSVKLDIQMFSTFAAEYRSLSTAEVGTFDRNMLESFFDTISML